MRGVSLLVVAAQNHPWMSMESITTPMVSVPATILNAMQEFQTYNHLKKAALTAVAYHLNNVCLIDGSFINRMI